MHSCSICGEESAISGTLVVFTTYRCEDKDYIILREDNSGKVRGYYEIVRYCPGCLDKYCLGRHSD